MPHGEKGFFVQNCDIFDCKFGEIINAILLGLVVDKAVEFIIRIMYNVNFIDQVLVNCTNNFYCTYYWYSFYQYTTTRIHPLNP